VQIVVDHVGYEPGAEKRLLIEAPAETTWDSCAVVAMPGGEVVVELLPVFEGGVEGWSCGPWWSLDATAVTTPGRYAVRWSAGGRSGQSESFTVAERSHGDQLVSDIVHYIKGQRCSGIWDDADRRAPRVGDGERRDVHGGWYDASGDYSKYLSHLSYANFMNPQQTPLVAWVLAHVWHRCQRSGAPPLLTERIREEALHGADFLVRMLDPDGFWYVTVFDGWSKVPEQRELCSYRTQLGHKGDDYQAGWRQGGGMAAAALAIASTLGDGPEHTAGEYVAAAQRGFEHLVAHGTEYLDDGRENIIDDTCSLLAATELTAASAERSALVAEQLDRRVEMLLARRRMTGEHVWMSADGGDRSWFHASDEGLPTVALSRFAEVVPEHRRAAAAADLAMELVAAQDRLDGSVNNPFGYPPHWISLPGHRPRVQWFYPHDNESGYWWQGENARLASLATAALMVAERERAHGEAPSAWRRSASRRVGWILGANPFDMCMLQGHGRNNPPYEPGFHNAPGGVCNGITSGFDDEADIAFRPMPAASTREQSWRWGEQWMPHAAWLMLALTVHKVSDTL
jgi:hypothetical protein